MIHAFHFYYSSHTTPHTTLHYTTQTTPLPHNSTQSHYITQTTPQSIDHHYTHLDIHHSSLHHTNNPSPQSIAHTSPPSWHPPLFTTPFTEFHRRDHAETRATRGDHAQLKIGRFVERTQTSRRSCKPSIVVG